MLRFECVCVCVCMCISVSSYRPLSYNQIALNLSIIYMKLPYQELYNNQEKIAWRLGGDRFDSLPKECHT